jgi:two-component system nitrogen regulation sensor histidine kinase NtrY
MPAPVIKHENILDIVRQAVFLQRNGHPEIRFEVLAPDGAVDVSCDARQVNQALINLLKNAAESIQGRIVAGDATPGHIWVRVEPGAEQTIIAVEDNGKGLPDAERDRLTEPYVTTRAKGTGLGLAIVKKIMEDHGGNLVLADRDGGGARIELVFAAGEAARGERAVAKEAV